MAVLGSLSQMSTTDNNHKQSTAADQMDPRALMERMEEMAAQQKALQEQLRFFQDKTKGLEESNTTFAQTYAEQNAPIVKEIGEMYRKKNGLEANAKLPEDLQAMLDLVATDPSAKGTLKFLQNVVGMNTETTEQGKKLKTMEKDLQTRDEAMAKLQKQTSASSAKAGGGRGGVGSSMLDTQKPTNPKAIAVKNSEGGSSYGFSALENAASSFTPGLSNGVQMNSLPAVNRSNHGSNTQFIPPMGSSSRKRNQSVAFSGGEDGEDGGGDGEANNSSQQQPRSKIPRWENMVGKAKGVRFTKDKEREKYGYSHTIEMDGVEDADLDDETATALAAKNEVSRLLMGMSNNIPEAFSEGAFKNLPSSRLDDRSEEELKLIGGVTRGSLKAENREVTGTGARWSKMFNAAMTKAASNQ